MLESEEAMTISYIWLFLHFACAFGARGVRLPFLAFFYEAKPRFGQFECFLAANKVTSALSPPRFTRSRVHVTLSGAQMVVARCLRRLREA